MIFFWYNSSRDARTISIQSDKLIIGIESTDFRYFKPFQVRLQIKNHSFRRKIVRINNLWLKFNLWINDIDSSIPIAFRQQIV